MASAQSATGGAPISLSVDLDLVEALPGPGGVGSWQLVYRPKVLTQTRRVESVEALLRWELPS